MWQMRAQQPHPPLPAGSREATSRGDQSSGWSASLAHNTICMCCPCLLDRAASGRAAKAAAGPSLHSADALHRHIDTLRAHVASAMLVNISGPDTATCHLQLVTAMNAASSTTTATQPLHAPERMTGRCPAQTRQPSSACPDLPCASHSWQTSSAWSHLRSSSESSASSAGAGAGESSSLPASMAARSPCAGAGASPSAATLPVGRADRLKSGSLLAS